MTFNLTYNFTDGVIQRLTYEAKIKDPSADIRIIESTKILNNIMLRLLDNVNPSIMYNILLDLLHKY